MGHDHAANVYAATLRRCNLASNRQSYQLAQSSSYAHEDRTDNEGVHRFSSRAHNITEYNENERGQAYVFAAEKIRQGW